MRRWVGLVGLVLIGGCGGDPATSRLEPGQAVLVYAPAPATEVPVRVADPTRPGAWGDFRLPAGMVVRVMDDDGGPGPTRTVRVSAGLMGSLVECRRDRLRPVR